MLEDTVPIEQAGDAQELKPGTDVGGYVVDGKLGQGGMGIVYGAKHPRIGKRVAIKVLERSYCNDASAVARFEQEARLVNEIRHPNIVDVFQFGELPDKRSYFVMECLTGETLSARIESAPLTVRETVEILDAICDALEAAHEHDVVHRDLKSDNVFLATTRGKRTVKLLDFGIAKLAGRNDLGAIERTASGIVVGTPAYMSPEQARGQAVGPRTDVYQLGILAYKMLTRRLPFTAENPFDLIVEQLKTPPPSPRKLAPATPDVLARLVVRMMAKTPDERPTVAEIRAVFAQLRQTKKKASAPLGTSILVGLALFMAGAAALGVFMVLQQRKDSAATQVAPPTAAPPVAAVAAGLPPAPPTGTASGAVAVAPPAALPVPPAPPEPSVDVEIQMDESTVDSSRKKRRSSDDAAGDDGRVLTEEEAAAAAEEEGVAADKPGAILFTLQLESEIEIDGKTVAGSTRRGRYEVSPGSHEIRVKSPGRQAVTRTVEVPAGGVAIISIADDEATDEATAE